MGLPDRDVALAWVGMTVVDRDGAEIGACTALFTDDATELPEWVCTELGGVIVFIPAVGAAESGGQVQVAVSRADVSSAPSVGNGRHISENEEAALYRHYRIPHSRAASQTLLPTEPSSEDVAPEASVAAAERLMAPAAPDDATPQATAAPEPMTASPASDDALPRPRPVSDVAGSQAGERAPSTRGRRLVLVLGGLAGLGATLAAVLQVRRLRRRRPPTRTERLVERVRAASLALRAGTRQTTASSAVPLVATIGQAVRRRPGVRAAAAGVAAVAVPVVAARRRAPHDASQDTPDS